MDSTQGTVLLVEDDTSIRRGLRATLAALQFEIGEASTGEETLMRLRMVDYDAVLVDLNMPGIGGAREREAAAGGAPLLLDARADGCGHVERGARTPRDGRQR